MTLPKLSSIIQTHTLTLSDDLTVSFQIRPIPGVEYQQIIDEHADEHGKTPFEVIAIPVLTAGITTVYSSVESTPADFTEADATELWEQWPEWARWDIYRAVIEYTTKGPGGNPFSASKPNENDEQ